MAHNTERVDEKSSPRHRKTPETQTDRIRAGHVESSHALQGAARNPANATPGQMLSLQRAYGNRAVTLAVQRASAAGLTGGPLDARTQSAIESARAGGAPLDGAVSAHVGGALGADFGGVKVHTDSQADTLNRSLNARAFTLGRDIFFSQGAYNPASSDGRHLLAHELTHVVQQGAAGGRPRRPQAKLTVGAAGDRYEQEADHVAAQVTRSWGTLATPARTIAQRDALGAPAQAMRWPQGIGDRLQRVREKDKNVKDSLEVALKPLSERGINLKEYEARLFRLKAVFRSPASTFDNDVKEAALAYVTSQYGMIGNMGPILSKGKPSGDFGMITNSAARWLGWAGGNIQGRMTKRANKEKEAQANNPMPMPVEPQGKKSLGRRIKENGLGNMLTAYLSSKLLDKIGKGQVEKIVRNSWEYSNLVSEYETLTHVYGAQLREPYRPEAFLSRISATSATHLEGAVTKQSLIQKARGLWRDRKGAKLEKDMFEFDQRGNTTEPQDQGSQGDEEFVDDL